MANSQKCVLKIRRTWCEICEMNTNHTISALWSLKKNKYLKEEWRCLMCDNIKKQ
jgi:hypothetical protein